MHSHLANHPLRRLPLSVLVAAALTTTSYAQFFVLQPGSSGNIDYGTRDLGAGGGATVFDNGGAQNATFGRLVDPGNNFDQLQGWVGGVPVANRAGGLAPGIQRLVPRGPDGAGNPNNFGPGFASVGANNAGIGFNFALSDPKASNGGVRGIDGSVIELAAEGTWTANVGFNGATLGMGMGLTVNLGQAGNYAAASLTGQYRVNGGAWFSFTPVVFATDGLNGNADFVSADFTSPNTAWLGDANPANDVTLAYSTWGFSRVVVGQGGAPNILPGNAVDFRMFFTAMADPDAGMDIFEIPPGESPSSDFGGSYTPVPEPEEYAALAAAGLIGFGFWRRLKRS